MTAQAHDKLGHRNQFSQKSFAYAENSTQLKMTTWLRFTHSLDQFSESVLHGQP